jgi:Cu(I)/Ag(I) efflux system membrane protein CusA/SilA
VTPSLGPDATGVGWVTNMSCLARSARWYLRYHLTKAEGVAEIASVGGFVQQHQVVVDPQKLQGYGLTLPQLTTAIRASNRDVGGRVVEMAETEYVVRGRGYLRNTAILSRSC